MKIKFENRKASLFVEDDLNTHVCVDSSDWYGYEAYLFFRKADLEGGKHGFSVIDIDNLSKFKSEFVDVDYSYLDKQLDLIQLGDDLVQ